MPPFKMPLMTPFIAPFMNQRMRNIMTSFSLKFNQKPSSVYRWKKSNWLIREIFYTTVYYSTIKILVIDWIIKILKVFYQLLSLLSRIHRWLVLICWLENWVEWIPLLKLLSYENKSSTHPNCANPSLTTSAQSACWFL